MRIDISNHTSDLINPEYLNSADLVVTLCGDAADKWAFFRRVRDEIGERIRRFAETGE